MSFKVEQMEEKNMVKLVIESTAEEFEAGLNKAYNKDKNKISIPGFRKGKAPRKMIEQMYGAEVFYEDAANAIIPEAYATAAEESKLEIVSQPKISVVQLEKGKPFIFAAEVAVKPEVELGTYKGVEVEKADTEVTDADVEEELKGKPATFKVSVKEIKEKQLPELDDDFAQDVSDFDTLAEYKEDLKKTISVRKENEAKAKKEDEAIAKIVETSKMDIPEAMINTQVNRMVEDFAQRLQQQGLSIDQYFQYTGMTADKIVEEMKPEAVKRIQTRLVLEAVAKAEDIQVSDEEFDAELQKMADMYKMELSQIKEFMGEFEGKQIRSDIAIQKAVDLIVNSTVEK